MDIYHPGQHDRNIAAVDGAARRHEKQLRTDLETAHVRERLSWSRAWPLTWMYLKFLMVYVIVMALTYYGVQTIAVWRFCRRRRTSEAHAGGAGWRIGRALKGAIIGIASFLLFCPAYVIAYSMRTELNTDTAIFMTLLCVISNGLLMVYANKFYAFLVTESRKGYVDAAFVKNLKRSYARTDGQGISLAAILRPVKRFHGHLFDHIYRNASFQYLGTIKEQASFLVTGMIITEMALNIHGHLSYEMLRQMLYRNWDIVIVVLLLIFYTVKATEIFTDVVVYRAAMRYENKT
jgi:hypothetical protein